MPHFRWNSLLKKARLAIAKEFSLWAEEAGKIQWGLSGAIDIMMESRQKVREAYKRREQWERRYAEISKKHKRDS